MKFKIIIFTLLFSTVFVAQSAEVSEKKTAKAANKILDEARDGLSALSADFEQYEINSNEQKSETSKGKVWLQSPNKFKWNYMEPVEQLIVADGKQIWIYDEDLEQVTIKRQNRKNNPIYVLLNKELTDKNYTISLLKFDTENQIQWLSMQPKIPNDEIKNVTLGIKDKQLVILKLENQMDNQVVFEFKNINKNPELESDFFSFELPEGVDVLRDSADIGEF